MADWDTCVNGNTVAVGNGCDEDGDSSHHSRQSSKSSVMSTGNKENYYSTVDSSSEQELIILEGSELTGESRTEPTVYENKAMLVKDQDPAVPSRQPVTSSGSNRTAKAKAAKSPYAATPIDSISEEEITIPNNANISAFNCDHLANFLRCLKVDERVVSHLYRKSVDGKRFSKFKDSELDTLGMNNAVVKFFRDKSNVKAQRKGPFML